VPVDFVFQGARADGMPTDVRLSELFVPGKDSLAIYTLMFPRDADDERPGPDVGQSASLPLQEGLCPSCAALLDQLDGAAEHIETAEGAPRPMLNVFHREGETIRHFWGSEFSMRRPSRGRTLDTTARSSRCGTCLTSSRRDAEPTGTSN
jgi:hypothetical protein